jgi:hypothetical protein
VTFSVGFDQSWEDSCLTSRLIRVDTFDTLTKVLDHNPKRQFLLLIGDAAFPDTIHFLAGGGSGQVLTSFTITVPGQVPLYTFSAAQLGPLITDDIWFTCQQGANLIALEVSCA